MLGPINQVAYEYTQISESHMYYLALTSKGHGQIFWLAEKKDNTT